MISLINTGASRLERSFLCTQRKLTSLALNVLHRVASSPRVQVEIAAYHSLVADTDGHGYARDERDELFVRRNAHANEPFLVVSWGLQCPMQKMCRILETEGCDVVLDVMPGK